MDENKIGFFDRQILRKMFELNKNEENEYSIGTNEELIRLNV